MACKNVFLLCLIIIILVLCINFLKCQKKKPAKKTEINLREITEKKHVKTKNKKNNNNRNGKTKPKNKKSKVKNGNNNNNVNIIDAKFLALKNGNLIYNNQQLFLSGVNIFYVNRGKDFGFGRYSAVRPQYEAWLKQISNAGGNSIRIVIHGDASLTPKLDAGGYPSGEDVSSLLTELGQFLDAAENNSVLAVISLWLGTSNFPANILELFSDESKLTAYLEKFLKPLVTGLSSFKALGMYDIFELAPSSVKSNVYDSNPCYDTRNLFHQWQRSTTNNVTMKNMQRFINRMADAIRTADPKALITQSSAEEESSMYCDWCFNYWSDQCLISAGGKAKGVLDIYGLDAVAYNGADYYWSPIRKWAQDYKLDKPILITQTSGNCSATNATTNFIHAYTAGYLGIFNWRYYYPSGFTCNDSPLICDTAMSVLRDKAGVKLIFK